MPSHYELGGQADILQQIMQAIASARAGRSGDPREQLRGQQGGRNVRPGPNVPGPAGKQPGGMGQQSGGAVGARTPGLINDPLPRSPLFNPRLFVPRERRMDVIPRRIF